MCSSHMAVNLQILMQPFLSLYPDGGWVFSSEGEKEGSMCGGGGEGGRREGEDGGGGRKKEEGGGSTFIRLFLYIIKS